VDENQSANKTGRNSIPPSDRLRIKGVDALARCVKRTVVVTVSAVQSYPVSQRRTRRADGSIQERRCRRRPKLSNKVSVSCPLLVVIHPPKKTGYRSRD
jgi:hypothetical protein